MDRWGVAALAAAAALLGLMALVPYGAVPAPAPDEPVWYLLVGGGVAYWVALLGWTRSRSE